MERILSVSNKPQSWFKGDQHITDEAGKELYAASWRHGFPTAIWTLRRDGKEVATLRRKALAPLRTCNVTMGSHEFVLRNVLSLSRRTVVEGGPFDTAVLSGDLIGLNFRLVLRDQLLAEAESKLLSMCDRYAVRLLSSEPEAELLTALMMMNLMVEKYEEA
ncbi:MAG TPA: hypothetical protein VGE16_19370 [Albitalea sp.]